MIGLNKVTDAIRNQTERNIIKHTKRLGVEVEIYFPTQSNSIYNDEDDNFDYPEEADFKGTLLVTNLTQEGQDTSEMDFILTEESERKIITTNHTIFLLDTSIPDTVIQESSIDLSTLIENQDYVKELPLNSMVVADLSSLDGEVITSARYKIDTISQYGNKLYKMYNLVPME